MKNRIRLFAAGAVAFMMGLPFTGVAKADDAGDITEAAFDLASVIIDMAGNS